MNSCTTKGKHVFIAYRQRIENIARKMGSYLRSNNMDVWFFPWRVGWGDSVTTEEEKGITNSFAGLIIFTPDFLEGRTSTEEYRALAAKKRENPTFKLGVLRVNCEQESVPPFLKDYYSASIDSYDDPNFIREAEKIRRGLYGLPLESEELFGRLYDFAFTEFGFDMMESEALEFADFWYEEMAQYDFDTFNEAYHYAKENIFSDCVGMHDLAKNFALEFTKKYSKKIRLNTVRRLHELMYDICIHLDNCEDISCMIFVCLEMRARGSGYAQIKTNLIRFEKISRFVDVFFTWRPLPWDTDVVMRFVWDWVEKFRNYDECQIEKVLKTAYFINDKISWPLDQDALEQLKESCIGEIVQLADRLVQVEHKDTQVGNFFAELGKIIAFAESQQWNFGEIKEFALEWFSEFRQLQFNLFKARYSKGIKAGKPAHVSIRYALNELKALVTKVQKTLHDTRTHAD